MYDWLARVTDFLIRMALAAIVFGAILAVVVLAFLLLKYAAHLI